MRMKNAYVRFVDVDGTSHWEVEIIDGWLIHHADTGEKVAYPANRVHSVRWGGPSESDPADDDTDFNPVVI